MPRQERQVRRSLVAAARTYSPTKRSRKARAGDSKRPGEEWQRASWDFFDLIPEYHQGCAITGALLYGPALDDPISPRPRLESPPGAVAFPAALTKSWHWRAFC